MLVVPVVVGAGLAGPRPAHALLLVTWLVGYLFFQAAGLWLRASRRPRWWPPVRAYGIATAVLGVVLLVLRPGLVWWAPLYAVLLATSLRLSARRRDRSVLNDLVTVVAACLVTVVAYDLDGGATTLEPVRRLPDDATAWTAAAVLLAYLGGTVFYVKTLIRDRGSRPMHVASVAWHVAGLVGVVVLTRSALLGAVAGVLLLRAAVGPLAWPRATPRAIGIGEVVASVVLTAALLVALPTA